MIRREALRSLVLGPGTIDYKPPSILYGSLSRARESFPLTFGAKNGSGKSTLALAIAHVIPSVTWAKVDLFFSLHTDCSHYSLCDAPKVSRIIPQRWEHSYLGYDLTDETLLAAEGNSPWSQHVWDTLNIRALTWQPAHTLSSGERRRLMVAFALAANPILLVSDEWSLNLDRNWKSAIHTLFTEYAIECAGAHLGLLNSADSGEAGAHEFLESELIGGNHAPEEVDSRLRQLASAFHGSPTPENGEKEIVLEARIRSSATTKHYVEVQGSRGDIIEVIGPNGSGKTTLLKNVWQLSRSRWMMRGRRYRCLPACFIMADPIYEILGPTVADELRRVAKDGILIQRALEVLGSTAERDVLTLSFGERKLLSLIVAVASPYPIIALDEPLSGLDVENSICAVNLINAAASLGKCVLASSQESFLTKSTLKIDLGAAE